MERSAIRAEPGLMQRLVEYFETGRAHGRPLRNRDCGTAAGGRLDGHQVLRAYPRRPPMGNAHWAPHARACRLAPRRLNDAAQRQGKAVEASREERQTAAPGESARRGTAGDVPGFRSGIRDGTGADAAWQRSKIGVGGHTSGRSRAELAGPRTAPRYTALRGLY